MLKVNQKFIIKTFWITNIFLLLFGLSSCIKEKSKPSSDARAKKLIIGKWKLEEDITTVSTTPIELNFLTNGTYIETRKKECSTSFTNGNTEVLCDKNLTNFGKYTINKDKITFIEEGNQEDASIIKLTKNDLVISYKGEGSTAVRYTRK